MSWNAPKLKILHTDKIASTHTRQPAFYEKHFTSKLILKRVKRLPSLAQQLARLVDISLGELPEKLPSENFIAAKDRLRNVLAVSMMVTDEKEVIAFYDETTAKFRIPLASALALHPKASFTVWTSLLSWTLSAGNAARAIEDGRLCPFPEDDDDVNEAGAGAQRKL